MVASSVPIEDDQNPCYCPAIPAVAYLESLRRQSLQQSSGTKLKSKHAQITCTRTSRSARFARMLAHHLSLSPSDYRSQSQLLYLPSFNELLNDSMDEEDLLMLQFHAKSQSTASVATKKKRGQDSSNSDDLDASVFSAPSWETKTGSRLSPSTVRSHLPPGGTKPSRNTPHHRALLGHHPATTFSDLQRSTKRERSSMTVNENSFELSGKADKLCFFPKNGRDERFSPYPSASKRVSKLAHAGSSATSEIRRRLRMLQDELYGPPIGTESPRGLKSLVSRLDALLPGARLKEKLQSIDSLSHQRIVDLLSTEGNITKRVLNILRTSEVECIDLTASMTDQEGLNLDADELLHVFSKPHSFLFLREINLSGTKLEDSDFRYIHHLPRLARLWISNTGIGNEAIFLLVPLKRSLTELDIAFNSSITDDAISALSLLYKIRFLTLLDTAVTMPGLRRLCAVLRQRKHHVELEVPRQCEIYVERMSTQYLVQPQAPFISDPSVVSQLAVKALRKNLAAHAEHNPGISTEGSKAELAARLKALLETRRADLGVREVLWKGSDDPNGNDGSEEEENVEDVEGVEGSDNEEDEMEEDE